LSDNYQPSTTLTSDKEDVFTGDSVTLSCTVESSGWKFYCLTLQPLSDNVTSEDSYTLIPAGPTPTGGYVCRAGRGDPSPSYRGVESGCVSNWGSITGSTCTISYSDTWDSGVYWCESGSGEYSNAVNITVEDGDVILESPVHPLTEGDSVTLRCKYWTTSSNIKADFYKDGILIKNETPGEMTIPAGESPESWMTVRDEKTMMISSYLFIICVIVISVLMLT
uniref:Ig-like domain-containing protein n=1 Tax=Oncorhynchus kisutch TaxID=8019 RepID=A0A8C7IPT7_ONCKI